MELIGIVCKINGTEYCLNVEPTQSLADLLRNELGLLGTKVSCGEGECGACTVIVNGKAINSCIMLAPEIDGSEVITIEGLSQTGEIDPIQQAFIDEGAVQCGFCTPGMLMSTKALLMEKSNPDEGEIRRALAGNLCRCTGYHRIVQAVKKAAQLKS
jgi:carbon-monoxide dehydrogenase small subunit